MKKRYFSLAILSIPLTLNAQVNALFGVVVLSDLVRAVGNAGEAISKLTNGLKDLIVAGNNSYKYVSAERERKRLIQISRQTSQLIANQNSSFIESLDQYIATSKRSHLDWSRVVSNIEKTLMAVQQLLTDVKLENGSFVLESAYLHLNQVLFSRSTILDQLTAMSPPESAEEIDLLKQVSDKYKILIKRSIEAVEQLNLYIKNEK